MATETKPEVEFVLPTKKVKAETKSPKNMVIFSKPKVQRLAPPALAVFKKLEHCRFKHW